MRGGGFREVSPASPLRAASSSPVRSRTSEVPWSSAAHRVQDVRCLKPFMAPKRLAFPCGQCQACRINKRRIWTHRIMLESLQYDRNGFVTLTYDEDHLPEGGSVSPQVLSGWVKRLRYYLDPIPLRYFAVGEYGDSSGRPHYHAAVFGAGCSLGPFRVSAGGGRICTCPTCDGVRRAWTFGHSMVGQLSEQSAQYIAGYVVKKMTRKEDSRLFGRHPEFARMSLKPGIGASAIPDVASVMMQYQLEKSGDVPVGLRHGERVWPLGRYLRRHLRLQVGLPENAPPEVLEALRQGLLPVYQYADAVCSAPGMARFKRNVAGEAFEKVFKQQAQNVAAKGLIHEKRKI